MNFVEEDESIYGHLANAAAWENYRQRMKNKNKSVSFCYHKQMPFPVTGLFKCPKIQEDVR